MEFHFYLPERYLPDTDRREAWRSGKITRLEEGGKIACAQCWIFQTWLALEQSGFPVHLVHSMPSEGVLVTLTNCVSLDFRAPDRVFFAGIVADYLPHPHAHLHIVQNAAHVKRLWNAAFIPLWSHPNLIPRDPARSDRFENVCFFGDPSNLAPELADKRWQRKLKDELGINFIVYGADRWHDYSEADCVAAVRGFGRSDYLHKPATKLYNAWLAGVPFIGGIDSAYAADGEPGRNFLRASTREELFAHIRRLKEEPARRDQLVAAGRIAGANFTSEAILDRWKHFLSVTVQSLAQRWHEKRAASRRVFFAAQSASVWLDSRLRR
ncbi:MAG: glycosyltransferase [Terrimicrobiaceae bacterium]